MLKFFKSILMGIGALAVLFVAVSFLTGLKEGYDTATEQAEHNECRTLATYPWLRTEKYAGVYDQDFDATTALKACTKAVEEEPDNAQLQYFLARAYLTLEQQEKHATHLQKAADLGEPGASLEIWIQKAPQNGAANSEDIEAFMKVLNAAVNSGHFEARLSLMVMHYQGMGVERDIPKTVQMARELAEDNYAGGAVMYASMITLGEVEGVEKAEATVWTLKAAELGNVDAMTSVGFADLEEGNTESALSWLEKAAKSGEIGAQDTLLLLYGGQDPKVPANIARFNHWIGVIATTRKWEALKRKANNWIKKHEPVSLALLEKAHASGHPAAAVELGKHYGKKGNTRLSNQLYWAGIREGDYESRTEAARMFYMKGFKNDLNQAADYFVTNGYSSEAVQLFGNISKFSNSRYWHIQKKLVQLVMKKGDKSNKSLLASYLIDLLEAISKTKKIQNKYYYQHVKFIYDTALTLLTESPDVWDTTRRKWGKNKQQIESSLSTLKYYQGVFNKQKQKNAVYQKLAKSGWKGECGAAPSLPNDRAPQQVVQQFGARHQNWDKCLDRFVKQFLENYSDLTVWKRTAFGAVIEPPIKTQDNKLADVLLSVKAARNAIGQAMRNRNKRVDAINARN